MDKHHQHRTQHVVWNLEKARRAPGCDNCEVREVQTVTQSKQSALMDRDVFKDTHGDSRNSVTHAECEATETTRPHFTAVALSQ